MKITNQILIVDDVMDNIQVAMNILKEDNYDFAFARDGEEALRLTETESFDLILLDIMMPGISGFEVCKKLQQNPQTKLIPVIFLTAKTDIDSITEGFELGAVDYVTKPFHPSEILARVKTHLQLSNATRLLQQHNIEMKVKVDLESHRINREIEETQIEVIRMLTSVMESFSDETGAHIRRVASYSKLLAQHYGMSEKDCQIISEAAPMHDIGKIAIDCRILHKPGKLDDIEYKLMTEHTTYGHRILQNSERQIMKTADIIAYQHHEKWNGTGYPQGLKGENIHIFGRIVALADVFDALTQPRSYKEAWPMEQVLQHFTEQSGEHFDPRLVEILIAHQDEFIHIMKTTQ